MSGHFLPIKISPNSSSIPLQEHSVQKGKTVLLQIRNEAKLSSPISL